MIHCHHVYTDSCHVYTSKQAFMCTVFLNKCFFPSYFVYYFNFCFPHFLFCLHVNINKIICTHTSVLTVVLIVIKFFSPLFMFFEGLSFHFTAFPESLSCNISCLYLFCKEIKLDTQHLFMLLKYRFQMHLHS